MLHIIINHLANFQMSDRSIYGPEASRISYSSSRVALRNHMAYRWMGFITNVVSNCICLVTPSISADHHKSCQSVVFCHLKVIVQVYFRRFSSPSVAFLKDFSVSWILCSLLLVKIRIFFFPKLFKQSHKKKKKLRFGDELFTSCCYLQFWLPVISSTNSVC